MAVSQRLSVTQLSQNIANNTSVVRITLTSTQTGESYNNNTLTGHYYIKKNGGSEVEYSFTTKLPKNSTVTCFTKDIEVEHNSDGTGSIAVRTSLNTHISAGTITKSATCTLETIARASQPTLSASSVEFNQTVTIYTNKASDSFAHQITYSMGNASGTIADNVGDSVSWKVPNNLMNQIPNSTSGTITITCVTFTSGSIIGSKSVTLTANIPSSVKPSINNVALSDPQGLVSTYGNYVQNKSKVKVEVTAAGSYSSTISKVQITAEGVTSTQNPYTSNALATAGNRTITVTVTDSRGRTASTSRTINVLAYTSPIITTLNAIRCNQDGSANDEGGYIKILYAGSITDIGGTGRNAKTLLVRYKAQDTSSWTNAVNVSEYSRNTSVIVAASTEKVYDISFVATDSFSSVEKTCQASTAFTLMDFRNTGKGIAFGKVSEKDAFECNLDATFNELVTGIKGFTSIFEDTTASDELDLITKKIALMPNTQGNYLINGGWKGIRWGFGYGSVIGDNPFKQVTYFMGDGSIIYGCKNGTGSVQYKKIYPKKSGTINDIFVTKSMYTVYGKSYYQYFVPLDDADQYNITLNSVTIAGYYAITSDCSIILKNKCGFIIRDNNKNGCGYPLSISITIY